MTTPSLNKIAKYFFEVNGKRIRPAIVLLMARAMRRGLIGDEKDGGGEDVDGEGGSGGATVPTPIDLAEVNGKRKGSRYRDELDVLLPTQHRLAEIAEIMHTASLLHDDVIDEGETRRGVPTVNAMYGNKFAILGGDFLLARASVAMGRLRNHDVTELMSMIIEHLVKGEILQLKTPPAFTPSSASASSSASGVVAPSATSLDAHLSRYLTKTYYKTASLIANSCHSVSLLAAHPTPLQTIAYEYGRSLGLAFQVIDDILDVVGDSAVMGKAGGWDLTRVVTAPVLYAMELDARVRERVLRGVREDEGEEVRRMGEGEWGGGEGEEAGGGAGGERGGRGAAPQTQRPPLSPHQPRPDRAQQTEMRARPARTGTAGWESSRWGGSRWYRPFAKRLLDVCAFRAVWHARVTSSEPAGARTAQVPLARGNLFSCPEDRTWSRGVERAVHLRRR